MCADILLLFVVCPLLLSSIFERNCFISYITTSIKSHDVEYYCITQYTPTDVIGKVTLQETNTLFVQFENKWSLRGKVFLFFCWLAGSILLLWKETILHYALAGVTYTSLTSLWMWGVEYACALWMTWSFQPSCRKCVTKSLPSIRNSHTSRSSCAQSFPHISMYTSMY